MPNRSLRSDPFTGRYLFHLHTTQTDGALTVAEYFSAAERERLDRLIFLEHIRTQPSYDVDRFVAEIRACAAATGCEAVVGFEAKVLPGGALDIATGHAALAEVIGIAEHGFPGEVERWHTSLARTFAQSLVDFPEKHLVWVHPGLWLQRRGLLEAQEAPYLELLQLAQSLGIRVESNQRYGLVPERLRGQIDPACLVRGADAHTAADLAGALRLLPPVGS